MEISQAMTELENSLTNEYFLPFETKGNEDTFSYVIKLNLGEKSIKVVLTLDRETDENGYMQASVMSFPCKLKKSISTKLFEAMNDFNQTSCYFKCFCSENLTLESMFMIKVENLVDYLFARIEELNRMDEYIFKNLFNAAEKCCVFYV